MLHPSHGRVHRHFSPGGALYTTVAWIKSHGGLTRANGDSFRSTLLSRGGSDDAMNLFRNFTGGEPDIKPLLERRGLDAPAK